MNDSASWQLTVRSDEYLDFAVRALVNDGLKVSPFDSHGPGSGNLRSRGLDGRTWIAWVQSIASVHVASLVAVRRNDSDGQIEALLATGSPLETLQRLSVSPKLIEALQTLDDGRGRMLPSLVVTDSTTLSPAEVSRLLDQMGGQEAAGGGDRVLAISIVNYERLVAMRVGPTSILVGSERRTLDWSALRGAILSASDPASES